MFEHVTVLLSFVFALALTHLLSSATELIAARDRLRFSGRLALWMVNAVVGLLVNWLGFWGLSAVKRWTVGEIILQFGAAVIQYFTCSLASMRVTAGETVDMTAFFERQRRPIMLAFLAMMVASMVQNYVDRDHTVGLASTDWIFENLIILPMGVATLLAGWARPVWLQWGAGAALLGAEVFFLVTYAVPAA